MLFRLFLSPPDSRENHICYSYSPPFLSPFCFTEIYCCIGSVKFDWMKFFTIHCVNMKKYGHFDKSTSFCFISTCILEGHNVVLTGQAGKRKLFLLRDMVVTLKCMEKSRCVVSIKYG